MRRRQPRNSHGNIIANPLEASNPGASVPVIDLTGDDEEEQASVVTPTSQQVKQSREIRRALSEHLRQTHHRYTSYQPYLHHHSQVYSQPHRPYHHHLRNPYQKSQLPLWGMPPATPRPHHTNVPAYPPSHVHSSPPPPPAPAPPNPSATNIVRTVTRWTDEEDTLLRGVLHRTPTPYHLIEPLLPNRTRSAIIQRVALLRSEKRQRVQHWHHLRELGRQRLLTRQLAAKPTHNLQPTDTIGETPQVTNPQTEQNTEPALRTRDLTIKSTHNLQPTDTIGETPQVTNPQTEQNTEPALRTRDLTTKSTHNLQPTDTIGETPQVTNPQTEQHHTEPALRIRELTTKPTHNLQPTDTVGETPQITNPQTENHTGPEPETRAAPEDSSDEDGLVGERRLAELLGCESSDEENKKEERATEEKLETEEVEFVFVAPKRDEYPYQKTETTVRDDLYNMSKWCVDDVRSRKRENDTVYDQDNKRVKKDEQVVVRGD